MSKRTARRSLIQLGMLALTLAVAGAALAQDKWPTKPIRIVVAFPPGGLTDAYARNYGEYLSSRLGVPVVIDNKPGAGAIIGIDAVAKAPADGYTLLMGHIGTLAVNPSLYPNLPYDPVKSLSLIHI